MLYSISTILHLHKHLQTICRYVWFPHMTFFLQFSPGENISTGVEIFLPWMKYFYLGANTYTRVEICMPQLKYLYPGGNILTAWELKNIIN